MDAPWYELAKGEIGVEEWLHGSNPRILDYHAETSLGADDDDVSWCSSFVCWCLEKSGFKSTRSASARSYLRWGTKLDIPREGCVVVFWRVTPTSRFGHVGFYVSQDDHWIKVLGGNQSNKVCMKLYPKSQLLGYRWPAG